MAQGLDHVIFVAAVERRLLFRIYAIKLKRSGTKVNPDSSGPKKKLCSEPVNMGSSLLKSTYQQVCHVADNMLPAQLVYGASTYLCRVRTDVGACGPYEPQRGLFTRGIVAQIPRVELVEMGPSLNLALRRSRPAAPDLEAEAMKQAKLTKKKVCVFCCNASQWVFPAFNALF